MLLLSIITMNLPKPRSLNTSLTRMTFLDDSCNPSFADADIVLFGVAFDQTASYKKGAWFGPHALLDASHQVEWEPPLSEMSLPDVVKIHNIGILEYKDNKQDLCHQMVQDTQQLAEVALATNKKIMVFGGEHSISHGVFKAIAQQHKSRDVTVLHIDAHLDLRDALHENKYSHGSVLRRCRELGFATIHVGIRDQISVEERAYVMQQKLEKNIFFCATMPVHFYSSTKNLIFDKTLKKSQIMAICKCIKTSKMYITIDVDGFDPSEMPGTGTPLPHGLSIATVKELLYQVIIYCKKNSVEILGFDITEVSPQFKQIANLYDVSAVVDQRTEMNAALLAYFIICMMYQDRFSSSVANVPSHEKR